MKKSELSTLIQERVQEISAAGTGSLAPSSPLRDFLTRSLLERICDAAAEVALSQSDKSEQTMRKELERAYRCIMGFSTARKNGQVLDDTAFAYHSPTIGAARRFVKEGALDGSDYFTGKKIDVLHAALDL